MISIINVCPFCNEKNEFDMDVTLEQLEQFTNRHNVPGLYVQHIFPELTDYERDFFLGGYCPKCWGNMYGKVTFSETTQPTEHK